MIILLFGISNVGKTTTGMLLAKRLNYQFYDMDEEIRKYYHTTTIGFVNRYKNLEDRDQRRAKLLKRLLKGKDNVVVAVTPISYMNDFYDMIFEDNILCIELSDTVENIFDRLVFTDDNDRIMDDSREYALAHKNHYMKDIFADYVYYHRIYSVIENEFKIEGRSPEKTVEELIKKYRLED
ncbi:MAG: shikimate kinase [Bacillota bacterium]|nr:shikimate kinase [Bacillota bacterium]